MYYVEFFKFAIIALILIFNGAVVTKYIYKTYFSKNINFLLLIGLGMIIGPSLFLLTLCLTSYLFKGFSYIRIFFFLNFIFSLILFKKTFKKSLRLNWNLWPLNIKKAIYLIIIAYAIFIMWVAPTAGLGPDTYIYNGISTSFARGNYPTVLPWQPQYLTVYHFGAFALFGALQSIFFINNGFFYFLFSGYILLGLFLIITGIFIEEKSLFTSFLPALYGLFMFGGPILLSSGLGIFLANFNIESLNLYPQFSDFRSPSGSGPSSLPGMIFYYFTTFGLALYLIFLLILIKPVDKKYLLIKYILLILFSILTLAVDESYFINQPLLLLIFFIKDHWNKNIFQTFKNFLILGILFIGLFFLIQNPVRDSFLTPSENPRFQLLSKPIQPQLDSFNQKFHNITPKENSAWHELKERLTSRINLTSSKNGVSWTLMNLLVSIVILTVLSIYLKSPYIILLSVSSALSLVFGSMLTNTYWPANFERFYQHSYNFIMLSLGFIIAELLLGLLVKKFNFLFGIILLIITLPNLLTAHSRLIYMSIYSRPSSLFDLNYIDQDLAQIRNFLGIKDRIIFKDSYPESASSYVNLRAITQFGIFVPLASNLPKVLSPDDHSVEFYDALTNLDPPSIKRMDLDYVFIISNYLNNLPQNRIEQINNIVYFQPVLTTRMGILYKVSNEFKALPSDTITLKKLIDSVPDNKNVYLDNFFIKDISKNIIFHLSKRTTLVGVAHSSGGGHFMYIEAALPYYPVCVDCNTYPNISQVGDIDFIFTIPTTKPDKIFPGKYEQIGQVPHVVLWKRIEY